MSDSLFQPDRHLSLQPTPWDPECVQAWLKTWAESALTYWQQDQSFPLHARDASDINCVAPQSLYCGALGVWLALERVQKSGWVEKLNLPDLPDVYRQLYQNYLATPDTGEIVPSWFLGESAFLTRLCLFPEIYHSPEGKAYQQRLSQICRENLRNPSRELLWGAPGTFLAPLMLWEATREAHWKQLCLEHIEAIWQDWKWFDPYGAWLWQQDLYGKQRIFLGAGHGWAGNLYGLWRAADLLSDAQYNQLRERTLSGVKNFARSAAGTPAKTLAGPVNWPGLADSEQPMLMQWCHGAPGLIWALQYADLPELDLWLAKGGEAIIAAGALDKGAALCHGTDGNGYALLILHQRLRNAPQVMDYDWLSAARCFGNWALQQSHQAQAESGKWHYSLWTGDAGLTCFLVDCLQKQAAWPGMERLF